MNNIPAPSFFITTSMINDVRTALAATNWQISDKVSYVERAAVIQLVIDWAQGRGPVEVPEKVAAVMDDSHIGSGRSGYSAAERINKVMAHLTEVTEGDRTPNGTSVAALYAPVTADGLKALLAWLAEQPVRETPSPVGEADETLEMHPNVRRELKAAGITTAEDRRAVMAHAHFRRNVSGGTSSSWIGAAARALRSAGSPEALMAEDQKDNERLMAMDRVRSGR